MNHRPKIVIIGAGFGGLFAARKLKNQPVDVLLIDKRNFHTFTPLIYQVATCALDPSDVAHPVRSIFRKQQHITFLMGEVTNIDYDARTIEVDNEGERRHESYDYLIVATGNTPTYFGNDDFRPFSFELNTLDDAVRLRNHLLKLFERAAWTADLEKRKPLTTIVVVGGGSTGLETAGAIYELYNHVLQREFPRAKLRTRVILIEMLPHLIASYPENLREAARKQLESLGVEVRLNTKVVNVATDHVVLGDDTIIPTHTLVWAAGVQASTLAKMLHVDLTKAGRIPIHPTTEVKGRQNIFAIGDIAYLEDQNGNAYPMLIPVAQQQGELAAENILRRIRGEAPADFEYDDRGTMVTIGRYRAVAWIYNRVPLTGLIAWFAWLGLHIVTLIGFRNRLNVLLNWAWDYLLYDRSVRIILEREKPRQQTLQSQDE